ncbi:fumarylacetoacetate hydrolase family protein [Bradyrhizobium sp. U87765 SZCCT0131]|uniref:fumarylacetoacetate hydrolase family protein n=1 Tax=unclassified Bradyrhizobium TaxID=2631580 RepID=UPI001BAD4BC9|nr:MULTISPECIES: fumarylacetoacetate hydrolase family protein [unclassified Bradyrhizobium]MBR1222452.1 fumarylacetoacetate hydrolase family protein [Bradyrhizobium sp. U87765 SZCCT0131]MBR1264064.1 fumarylacetoacetate hydrolase family protein [Bradyrhizobium sp. U87765 SZCCT0134]MBR1308153.1 fumarylacetoacetate hydrolase family protein [Bradyrhizobium sp. U87765 SZCCT0110]MBR1320314.1 fumarylacetoacetate hydrolase family protein [Bradyrhizobium sp. U87765 SZCCT0109]MBR1348573.1 fumarylacetoac
MQQFARVLTKNGVVPVILRRDVHLDLRPIVADITPDAIASGALTAVDTGGLSPVSGPFTYLTPINGVRQIAATGFNYKKHIEEFKMQPPTEPEVFLKAITSLTGPDDPISRGLNPGTKLDWEVELTIVVGREAQDITAAEAANYIFGYVCLNDVSDRTTQVDSEGGQHLVRAKSRPGYTPVGPFLTTGVDGMNLNLWTKVNGRYEQQGNTNDMLFSITEMLAYFSRHMKLLPGDLLATGTPPGVGFGKNRFLAPGDVLECGIANLGAQRHEILK